MEPLLTDQVSETVVLPGLVESETVAAFAAPAHKREPIPTMPMSVLRMNPSPCVRVASSAGESTPRLARAERPYPKSCRSLSIDVWDVGGGSRVRGRLLARFARCLR